MSQSPHSSQQGAPRQGATAASVNRAPARHAVPSIGLGLAAAACCALGLMGACTDAPSTGPGGTGAHCGAGTVFDPNSGACVVGQDGVIGGFDGSVLDTGGADASGATDDSGVADSTADSASDDAAGADDTGVAKDAIVTKSWWEDCPPAPINPNGALHGKACTTDDECLYGHCLFGAPLAGYNAQVGICTKPCNCGQGGKTGACSYDDGGGSAYYCAYERKDGNPDYVPPAPPYDNKVIASCGKTCKCSGKLCLAEPACIAWNPDLPDCIGISSKALSLNPNGTCGKWIED